MKMYKSESMGNLVKQVCKITFYGLLAAVSCSRLEKHVTYRNYGSVSSGYGEAVAAIMESNMFSCDKEEAVTALKANGSADFYKAIVSIVRDPKTFSCDKRDMIKALSKK